MKCLDLTMMSPAANLACDEALLDACDGGGEEVLRFWEPQDYFVVVGFGNHVSTEANVPACERSNVPVLRRCSGGGAVLQGPGCLNYSVILKIDSTPELQTITNTNHFVMERHQKMFSEHFGLPVIFQGQTDLTLGEKKFSGNAQRRKRNALVFHGTFLLNFDLAMIEKLLLMPSKEPDYRKKRAHEEFVVNLGLTSAAVKGALQKIWQTTGSLNVVPDCDRLVAEKYGRAEWNFRS